MDINNPKTRPVLDKLLLNQFTVEDIARHLGDPDAICDMVEFRIGITGSKVSNETWDNAPTRIYQLRIPDEIQGALDRLYKILESPLSPTDFDLVILTNLIRDGLAHLHERHKRRYARLRGFDIVDCPSCDRPYITGGKKNCDYNAVKTHGACTGCLGYCPICSPEKGKNDDAS